MPPQQGPPAAACTNLLLDRCALAPGWQPPIGHPLQVPWPWVTAEAASQVSAAGPASGCLPNQVNFCLGNVRARCEIPSPAPTAHPPFRARLPPAVPFCSPGPLFPSWPHTLFAEMRSHLSPQPSLPSPCFTLDLCNDKHRLTGKVLLETLSQHCRWSHLNAGAPGGGHGARGHTQARSHRTADTAHTRSHLFLLAASIPPISLHSLFEVVKWWVSISL